MVFDVQSRMGAKGLCPRGAMSEGVKYRYNVVDGEC